MVVFLGFKFVYVLHSMFSNGLVFPHRHWLLSVLGISPSGRTLYLLRNDPRLDRRRHLVQ